jgi:hypothetical protein
MDYRDIDEYPKIIKEILIEYSKFKPAYGDIKTDVVFDDECWSVQKVFIFMKARSII